MIASSGGIFGRTRSKRNYFSGNIKKNIRSVADVLRKILFSEDNKIDWGKAGFSIIENMPELKMFE